MRKLLMLIVAAVMICSCEKEESLDYTTHHFVIENSAGDNVVVCINSFLEDWPGVTENAGDETKSIVFFPTSNTNPNMHYIGSGYNMPPEEAIGAMMIEYVKIYKDGKLLTTYAGGRFSKDKKGFFNLNHWTRTSDIGVSFDNILTLEVEGKPIPEDAPQCFWIFEIE